MKHAALVAVTLALVTLVLLPCVVSISPAVYFDVDPRSDMGGQPVTTLGPAGAAWLHVLSVLVAAAALGVHRWLGGRVRWGACALAAAGFVFCAWHMPQHFVNRLHGGAWVAGVAMGLAAAHLGEHRAARRWMVAGCVAMLVPMAVDALWFVLVEHPETVRQHMANREQLLRGRGWAPDSTQAQLFERRLKSPDVVGAFGLSNVLGTVVASFTVLAFAVCCGFARRRPRAWALLPAAVAVAGLMVTWLTRSRGAQLAVAAALLLVLLVFVLRKWGRGGWIAPGAGLMGVAVAFVGVLCLGVFHEPRGPGDPLLSLVFRYHYWQGAATMFAEQGPGALLRGLGAAQFRADYLWAKNPLNPEEVTSAHNVFVDYIAMLGVGGAAWSALLVIWLWQGGRGAVRALNTESDSRDAQREGAQGRSPLELALMLAVFPAAVVFGAQYVLELATFWWASVLLWLGGVAGFIVVMGVLAARMRVAGWWVGAGVFGAAAVALVHGQIDMAFFQVSSAGTAWALVGLAAGLGAHGQVHASQNPERFAWIGRAAVSAVCIVAVWLVVVEAVPLSLYQNHLGRAADALQQGRFRAALRALDDASAVIPRHPETQKQRVRLRLEAASALGRDGRRDAARQVLAEADRLVDQAQKMQLPGPTAPRLRASVAQTRARLLNQDRQRQRAAEALQEALDRAPYSLKDRLRLGDLYWHIGQRAAAAEQYRWAQRISDKSHLDPTKKLNAEQRAHIAQRLQAARQEP